MNKWHVVSQSLAGLHNDWDYDPSVAGRVEISKIQSVILDLMESDGALVAQTGLELNACKYSVSVDSPHGICSVSSWQIVWYSLRASK